MPKLTIYIRDVYGKSCIYFSGKHDDPLVRAVRQLTRKMTLSPQDLDALETLGIELEWGLDPRSEGYRRTTATDNTANTTNTTKTTDEN